MEFRAPVLCSLCQGWTRLPSYRALGCRIMWKHLPWPASSRSPNATTVQAPSGMGWEHKKPCSKSERGWESWGRVECSLQIGGAGRWEAFSSTKLFKSWFRHFPAWWSLLMCLTFRIWFLPLQTWDNGMRFLPHGVVLNNKSMIRHEAYSTSVTRSHPDTECNQQTGLDVKPHGNTINFLSSNLGRFFFPFCPIPLRSRSGWNEDHDNKRYFFTDCIDILNWYSVTDRIKPAVVLWSVYSPMNWLENIPVRSPDPACTFGMHMGCFRELGTRACSWLWSWVFISLLL